MGIGDGVENAAHQADDAAHQSGCNGKNERIADTGEIGGIVVGNQFPDIFHQFDQLIHGEKAPFKTIYTSRKHRSGGSVLAGSAFDFIRFQAERKWSGS